MEINITWNICRVCLQEESKSSRGSAEQMRNIFNEDKMAHYIYEFTGIFMKPNDSLPEKICVKCMTAVNNAVQFRKICRASNTYLQSILKRTKLASSFFKPKLPDCEIDGDDVEEEENSATKTENLLEEVREEEVKQNKEATPRVEEVQQAQTKHQEEDTALDLEDIIEHSEEINEQEFSEEILKLNVKAENNVMETHKTSQVKKLCINDADEAYDDHYETKCGLQETMEMEISNLKVNNNNNNNDSLYYSAEGIKNENTNSSDMQDELENPEIEKEASEPNGDYYTIEDHHHEDDEDIDGELILHMEEQHNGGGDDEDDNHAQVTSTVETKDEIEYQEQHSNISSMISDLEEEYILDNHLNNYNNTANFETSMPRSRSKKTGNFVPSPHRTSPIIFPRRSQNSQQYSATGLQVCVCEICGNKFTSRSLMNTHMRVHYQEKNHQCELCFKSFITACNLQAHMRIHTGEKPFACKYCGRRFNDRSSNLRHERTHTNEKPFKCASCGKTFTLATTLQNHMKVHTNERSYRCEPCGKSFKLPHHLKTHLNTTLHRSVMQIVGGN